MARHCSLERLTYDSLYAYVVNRFWPRPAEHSVVEFDRACVALRWVTLADTGCGMDLRRPPLHPECVYRLAPRNSVVFARTGGDGVHYSLLVHNGHWSELSPVVVTRPTAFGGNIVVGETLAEFLRMGLRVGYFALPNFLPDADGRFEDASVADVLGAKDFAEWVDSDRAASLNELARHFGLEPVANPAERLTELQRQFQHLLEPPPDRGHPDEALELMDRKVLEQFRPGDEVIWDDPDGPSVKATVISVGDGRVTIHAGHQDRGQAPRPPHQVSPHDLRFPERVPVPPEVERAARP